MGLTNVYVQTLNKTPTLFKKIQDAQAPTQFSHQILKDWGLTSSNDRAFIPLLKALGFLSSDGVPTKRYLDYRDNSKARRVLADGIREAYEDLFLINSKPGASDRKAIEGKFKSFHNTSDNLAQLMTKTFFKVLELADLDDKSQEETDQKPATGEIDETLDQNDRGGSKEEQSPGMVPNLGGLHYNIQIHLPATKDVEVYNAIFKSLKEHLVE